MSGPSKKTGLLSAVLFFSAPSALASASMAKTVLGMLVGIAVHERKITSLDHAAGYYVPRMRTYPYSEISIRDLLTMSSGMASREGIDGRDEDTKLLGNTLGRLTDGGFDTIKAFEWRIAPAGTKFRYSSADS